MAKVVSLNVAVGGGDSFIVNLGSKELARQTESLHPRDLDNWHVDGDLFVSLLGQQHRIG